MQFGLDDEVDSREIMDLSFGWEGHSSELNATIQDECAQLLNIRVTQANAVFLRTRQKQTNNTPPSTISTLWLNSI